MEYPLFNSKALSDGNVYNLTDPVDRLKYYHAKLGTKIDDIKEYLEHDSFIGYMLAKKQAGKGTYAKMVEDILGPDRFAHISVGDVIRKYHLLLDKPLELTNLITYLEKNYRGILTIDEALDAMRNRSQDKVSIPTEFLLCLLKKEILEMGKKALFIDGLPRNMDQINSSLYFRDLINYRDDPDFFILIDSPLELLNARLVNRRVCPVCQTSRNLLFNPTENVKYDTSTGEYNLVCDNPVCSGFNTEILISKEGDSLGIKSIEERLKQDEALMQVACKLQGIPKIMLKGVYKVDEIHKYAESYEIQQGIEYSHAGGLVEITKKDWVFKDDEGVESNTIYAATYVVNLLTQIHKLLIG